MQEKVNQSSNLKDRLLKFIELKSVSKNHFHKKIGVGNGYLDKVSSIGSDVIENIVEAYPDLNINWLFTGEGLMVDNNKKEIQHDPKGIPMVPMEALAGQQPGELVIHDYDIEQRYLVPEFNKADFLIRVKGSSMYPKYSAGDILACKKVKKSQFIQWNKAYVIDTTQGIMVKRIIKGPIPTQWILRSDNKDYQDIDINPEDDIHHISLVIGVIRFE
jgi:SOS-response transcriptional repressor LexA